MARNLILIGVCVAALMSVFAVLGRPREVPTDAPDDAWFQSHVANQPGLVLVDFQAEWCGPCRMLEPKLTQLKSHYRGQLKVVSIDVDKHNELAGYYKIDAIPHLMLMRDGKVLDHFIGLGSLETLKDFVNPHLKSVAALP